MTTYTLSTLIRFGLKHRGKTVQEVMQSDPGYLIWAAETIDWFELDQDLYDDANLLTGGRLGKSTGKAVAATKVPDNAASTFDVPGDIDDDFPPF